MSQHVLQMTTADLVGLIPINLCSCQFSICWIYSKYRGCC